VVLENENEEEESEDEEPAGGTEYALSAVVEAFLIAAGQPLPPKTLAKRIGRGITPRDVEAAVERLRREHAETGRAFEILHLAGSYQLATLPEHAPFLLPEKDRDEQRPLSPAALDTLSIVAYRQPIIRAKIEEIRGVACGPILKNLMERRLVRIVGRDEDTLGKPMLYGTTRDFLKAFGLGCLDELPFRDQLSQAPAAES
jgi:segregation and condensation protein B